MDGDSSWGVQQKDLSGPQIEPSPLPGGALSSRDPVMSGLCGCTLRGDTAALGWVLRSPPRLEGPRGWSGQVSLLRLGLRGRGRASPPGTCPSPLRLAGTIATGVGGLAGSLPCTPEGSAKSQEQKEQTEVPFPAWLGTQKAEQFLWGHRSRRESPCVWGRPHPWHWLVGLRSGTCFLGWGAR